MTVNKNEMFDFLIDIIPRDETSKDFNIRREPENAPFAQTTKQGNREPGHYAITQAHDNTGFMKNPLSSSEIRPAFSQLRTGHFFNAQSRFGEHSDIANEDLQSEKSHFGSQMKR